VRRADAFRARLRPSAGGLVDVAVAGALATVVVTVEATRAHFAVGATVAAVVVCLSISFRRDAPAAAVFVSCAGAAVVSRTSLGSLAVIPIAFVLNYYSLGHGSAHRRRPWLAVALLLLPLPGIAADPSTSKPGGQLILDVAFVWAFFFVIPYVAGRVVAGHTRLTHALRANADRLAQEQQTRAHEAVVRERTRIARELHDVVAHSVSVMVIQSAAARRVAPHDPDAAATALAAVEACGRDALVDLRRMVGVLHRGDRELLGAVSPGVGQLDGLIERARASGISVDLRVEGRVQALSTAVDLVVFRVVQEALTNTIKHAGPTEAHVRVRFDGAAVDVEITDSGRRAAPPLRAPDAGSGHGLVGMRERLAMYGGQLEAGRARDGGFRIHARIPLGNEVLV
jgi:signal transduction histidine kinase